MYFGNWVEGKLNTLDADGHYPYSIDDVLNDKPLKPYKKSKNARPDGRKKNIAGTKQEFQSMGFRIEKLPSGKVSNG